MLASQVHPRVAPTAAVEYLRRRAELEHAYETAAPEDRAAALEALNEHREGARGVAVHRGTW